MATTWLATSWDIAVQIYHAYPLHGWPLIYYPLFYLGKAIKQDRLRPDSENYDASRYTIITAIAVLAVWMLGQNCTYLLRDTLKRRGPPVEPGSEFEDDHVELRYDGTRTRVVVSEAHQNTDISCGLSTSDVVKRRELYGPGEDARVGSWYHALFYAATRSSFLPAVLSASLAIVLQDWSNLFIFASLLGYGVVQTFRPVRNMQQVKSSLMVDPNLKATVKRESEWMTVLATELVTGDVVKISQDMTIPADIRIRQVEEALQTDQSAITGDSTPIDKNIGDIIYCSTGVITGVAIGIVQVPTRLSFIGRTIELIGNDPTAMNTAKGMKKDEPLHVIEYVRMNKALTALTLMVVTILLILVLSVPKEIDNMLFVELILALVVINWLTGRATVLNILRTCGAAKLADEGVVDQSRLNITDSLAGVNTLCTDKTGTLTTNKLVMDTPFCLDCSSSELLAVAAVGLQPDASSTFHDLDPIDTVFANALSADADTKTRWQEYQVLEATPFDPDTGMVRAVAHNADGDEVVCVHGAPKRVFEMCQNEGTDLAHVQDQFIDAARGFARQGYRALGVARHVLSEGSQWELLGLVPMTDAVRKNAAAALRRARLLGVDTKMITGDASLIAEATAKSLGINDRTTFLAGALREYVEENPNLSMEEAVMNRACEAFAFSEAFPDDKEAIVRFFQSLGRRVAITGDGLSDQPVLLKADCGIANAGSSEAAQSVADLVCLKSGIARIVRAIEISRQVFQQVRSYLIYRTVIALQLAILETASYLMYGSLLTDMQWLILNTHVTDMVGVHLVSDHGRTPFPQAPSRWTVRRSLVAIIALTIIVSAGSVVSVLLIPNLLGDHDPELVQQVAFLSTSLTSHWLCLLLLTNGRFWTHIRYYKSLGLLAIIDFGSRLSYFGWSGRTRFTASDALLIWGCSLATLGLSALVCSLAADGRLIYGKSEWAGKDESVDSDEEADDSSSS